MKNSTDDYIKDFDLMIGNWVILEGEPTLVRNGEIIDDYSDQMFPIMINAVVLVRCGLSKNAGDEITYRHRTGITITKFGRMEKNGDFLTNVKYLHSFQNVIFCLTGMRVEYNPGFNEKV